MVSDAHLSADPRIYANGWNYFYPDTNAQDNSDLPAWVVLSGPSLVDWGLPGSAAKVYLQLWVAEKQNFFCVAQVLTAVANGAPLDQALS